eukprot:gnl/MRDRNA2_/MRDRNA2_137661_c0_seq1.p1 gnl/MRDRNA2_/MRDRNA2_137661_c0~~gnl/MRDRNA2_/MRDRNA2_137661_c0_seq1.p1  ORF type:complete len:159 (-),score=12.18 gnl/MRDRNA2_/MRDRNA2_137661_c0_seq1:8-484(-)
MFFSKETTGLIPKAVEQQVQASMMESFKKKLFGSENTTSLIGMGISCYLTIVSVQSLLFSFRFSVYSLIAAAIVAVGEVPFLLSFGPLAILAPYFTPIHKAIVYALLALGGAGCFYNISWNIFLLAGHGGIAFLATRYYAIAKDPASENTASVLTNVI